MDRIYRDESRRVLATLIRLLGDFDLAEDAMQEAFAAAIDRWPRDGVPANPRAWLVSTGRFKAIDSLRRRTRFRAAVPELAGLQSSLVEPEFPVSDETIVDDQLRLIFTCCHPALAEEAQVALTLREVCGLTTEAIARAYLTSATAVAQRIVRAKAKIREARIPYEVPARDEWDARLEVVLRVVYLVFNEGYTAPLHAASGSGNLAGEAIRLGKLLAELLPDAEVRGLVALMLFQESRRAARTTPEGALILLADQDRALWDRGLIAAAVESLKHALSSDRAGPYAVQAAIAGVHAGTVDGAPTDWARIVGLYDLLLREAPSPVVELNRAVAVAECDGPAAGLELVDTILSRGDLRDYHLAHAVRADFLRRLRRATEARAAYDQAIRLATHEHERTFLERRKSALADLNSPDSLSSNS
ncbi:MAG TPA: RNA polymerase sigma factor [Opitutaceae bacterium]|nr:RNA polymerase sigma factor [Opitutaceae bacterium]